MIVSIILIVTTAYFLPSILDIFKLSVPQRWPTATRIVVQITIGSWLAASLVSITRVIVWLRAMLAITTLTEYGNERKEVMLVRDFILWLLGLMTALAIYMTQWFSGGN